MLLICPDAAMLLAQAKQTEEEGRIVWLPLNPLWKSSSPSGVGRHNCSSNLCFYILFPLFDLLCRSDERDN